MMALKAENIKDPGLVETKTFDYKLDGGGMARVGIRTCMISVISVVPYLQESQTVNSAELLIRKLDYWKW